MGTCFRCGGVSKVNGALCSSCTDDKVVDNMITRRTNENIVSDLLSKLKEAQNENLRLRRAYAENLTEVTSTRAERLDLLNRLAHMEEKYGWIGDNALANLRWMSKKARDLGLDEIEAEHEELLAFLDYRNDYENDARRA